MIYALDQSKINLGRIDNLTHAEFFLKKIFTYISFRLTLRGSVKRKEITFYNEES